MSEIDSTLARIKKYDGVEGYSITHTTKGGFRSNFTGENKKGGIITNNAMILTKKARVLIRDLDPTNDLTFLRIKTKNKELMVAPDNDFMFIVLHDLAKDKTDHQL